MDDNKANERLDGVVRDLLRDYVLMNRAAVTWDALFRSWALGKLRLSYPDKTETELGAIVDRAVSREIVMVSQ